MLHVDIPSRSEFEALRAVRDDACVAIYLETTPLTQDIQASVIALGNLARQAVEQLQAAGIDKRRIATLTERLDELGDDDAFWRVQANSLAILATPDRLRTFRLPSRLASSVHVGDRFHVAPLLRAITFTHAACVLALSENAVRVVEVQAELAPVAVRVEDLPSDAASTIGKATLNDRSAVRRIQGSEGENVRLQQYARKVDAAMRRYLAGRDTPLILAATGRLASVYRSVNGYPHLLPDGIEDSPDRTSEGSLADAARPVLDAHYARLLADVGARFEQRSGDGRATSDVAEAARAATFGAIDTLLIDIEAAVPGTIDEQSGAVTFAQANDATTYGVVDEIAARALASGAKVYGVRRADLPRDGAVAAILRFAL